MADDLKSVSQKEEAAFLVENGLHYADADGNSRGLFVGKGEIVDRPGKFYLEVALWRPSTEQDAEAMKAENIYYYNGQVFTRLILFPETAFKLLEELAKGAGYELVKGDVR